MNSNHAPVPSERPRGGLSTHALRRVILSALVVAVTVSSVGVLLLVQQIFANFGPAVEKDLEWMAVRGARELSAASALGLAIGDAEMTREHWVDHMKSKDVVSIVAHNPTGGVVARYGNAAVAESDLFAGPPGRVRHTGKHLVSWSESQVEGGIIGRVAIVIGTRRLTESRALLQNVRAITGASALFALVGGVLFVTFFTRAIIRRDAQLAEYAATLERKVAARTAELDERNRGMRLVLDNVSQGFITISITGVMAPERSAIVDIWLGTPTSGETFDSFIRRLDPKGAGWFAQGLAQIQDDILPLDLLIDQMPKRVTAGVNTLALTYIPILRLGKVENLLIVMTNITAELERERLEREQKEMLSMFQAITSDRGGFLDFLSDTGRLAQAIANNEAESIEVEKRLVHTLKGNAGLFRLDGIVQVCHDIETRMTDEPSRLTDVDRATIGYAWKRVQEAAQTLVGDAQEAMVVPLSDYGHLEALLQHGATLDTIRKTLQSWVLEPVSLRFERLSTQVRQLAQRLDKPDMKVHVNANGVRLQAGAWTDFWACFVHVARNAVDHGIEPPAERLAAGKPSYGSLWLSAFVEEDALVIVARDDGRGIDWERLAQKAAAKGLAHTSQSDLESAIFADGVSTLDAATTISGRGVGMAAVQHEVIRRGGSIRILSERGQGTSFVFRFPKAGAFCAEQAA